MTTRRSVLSLLRVGIDGSVCIYTLWGMFNSWLKSIGRILVYCSLHNTKSINTSKQMESKTQEKNSAIWRRKEIAKGTSR